LPAALLFHFIPYNHHPEMKIKNRQNLRPDKNEFRLRFMLPVKHYRIGVAFTPALIEVLVRPDQSAMNGLAVYPPQCGTPGMPSDGYAKVRAYQATGIPNDRHAMSDHLL
jgi:hypothetical protein